MMGVSCGSVATLLLVVVCPALSLDYFGIERCAVGSTAQHVPNQPADREAIVYHNLVIPCDGKLKYWEIFPENKGPIYMTVWRPLRSQPGIIQLIGKNMINVGKDQIGKVLVYEVPRDEQIHVQTGDELGFHYKNHEKGSRRIIWMDKSVPVNASMYELSDKKKSSDGQKLKLYHNLPVHVPRKHNLLGGMPAIRARITNTNPYLRLEGSAKNYEGRAEIYRDGEWGTICDKWWQTYGWPMLFCREMGFENVTSIVNYTQFEHPIYRADESAMIAMQNPRCKLTQNISLAQCDRHNDTCDHTEDLFIRCVPKVRLYHPQNSANTGLRDAGVPQVYQYGEWRMICDETDPEWHYQNPDNSWVTAFCKEMNYKGFMQMDRYPQPGRHFTRDAQNFKVGYENPSCWVDKPTRMAECPSVHYENSLCKDHTYFIRCAKTESDLQRY